MPGLHLTLPVSFTDTSLPKLRDDQILPDAGALMFVDPTHPAGPWAGTVTDGALVPNLAYAQAKALIPAGTEASLSLAVRVPTEYLAIGGVAERSGKGGIHFMPPRATPGDATAQVKLWMTNGTTPLNAYLRANTAHKFYAATWGMVTRAPLALDAGAASHSRSDGSQQIWMFYNRPAAGGTQYPNDARQLGNYGTGVAPAVGGQPFFQDQATQPTATNSVDIHPLLLGNSAGAANYGKSAGMVMYGFYLEDLTVSGRDYATVSALVKAKYAKDVTAAGARYAGDTYTTAP